MATQTLTPYEQTLQDRKADLENQIVELGERKVTAQREAANKLAGLPAHADLARKSALASLSEIDAHVSALTVALADVNEALAGAPALLEGYAAEVKALDVARGHVDRASTKAEAALEAFLDANAALVAQYRQAKALSRAAVKTYNDLGRPGDVPSVPKFRWAPALYQRVRDAPMVQIVLTGDRSIG